MQLKQRAGYDAVIFESGLGSRNTGSGSTFVLGTDLATTNQVLLRAESRWGVHLLSLTRITRVALA